MKNKKNLSTTKVCAIIALLFASKRHEPGTHFLYQTKILELLKNNEEIDVAINTMFAEKKSRGYKMSSMNFYFIRKRLLDCLLPDGRLQPEYEERLSEIIKKALKTFIDNFDDNIKK